ncbi:HAD-IIB family hydrolase [Rothia terrae]|uniref:HAD-IIB family hydrolase n=1 Tax=Rothia terrae TaxID=396015 RepID=UPI00381F97E1
MPTSPGTGVRFITTDFWRVFTMKKLMAFDVDGTLFVNGEISRENAQAIKRWQDAGNLAVCSTGKSLFAAKKTFEGSGIDFDFYVLFTGAVVTRGDEEVLFEKSLPKDVVAEVVERLVQYDNISVFATDIDSDYELHNPLAQSSHMLLNFVPLKVEELAERDIIGIPIQVADDALRADIHRWLTEEYAGQLDAHLNQDFIDIVPANCDKSTGLRWLNENVFAGEQIETYSIGDSWNDLPMHAWAQHSASFNYSPQDVKDATETVVEHSWEYINSALGESGAKDA